MAGYAREIDSCFPEERGERPPAENDRFASDSNASFGIESFLRTGAGPERVGRRWRSRGEQEASLAMYLENPEIAFSVDAMVRGER